MSDVDKVAMSFVVSILIMEDWKVRRKLVLFSLFFGLAGGRMKVLSSFPFSALAFGLFLRAKRCIDSFLLPLAVLLIEVDLIIQHFLVYFALLVTHIPLIPLAQPVQHFYYVL